MSNSGMFGYHARVLGLMNQMGGQVVTDDPPHWLIADLVRQMHDNAYIEQLPLKFLRQFTLFTPDFVMQIEMKVTIHGRPSAADVEKES